MKSSGLLLLALSLIAFALRVPGLSQQSLWRDEVDAIVFSSGSLPELVQALARPGHNGPLYFVILRGWRALTGDTEFALRFFSAAWGVLLVPLVYALARRLGLNRRVGLTAALLATTAPYLVWYSQEAKMYTLLAALVAGAMVAYLTAMQGRGPIFWALFALLASLSFYTHILAALMVVVYVGAGLVFWLQRRPGPTPWKGWSLSIASLTVPYVPLAAWQFPLIWQALQQGVDTGHRFYPLPEQIHLLLRLYNRGLVRPPFELYATILSLFLLLAGLFLVRLRGRGGGVRGGRPWPRWVLLLWLALPVLLVFFISRYAPVFEDRYLIYITPAFFLMVAFGVSGVRRYARPLALLCLGLVVTFHLWGAWRQASLTIKADFRAAAAFIEARLPAQGEAPMVMLQMPYLERTFDYYFAPDFQALPGPWTNDGRSPESVASEMAGRLAGVDQLWLVVSEEEMWDRRALARGWLEAHAQQVEAAHFVRVDVYRYVLAAD